MAYAGGRWEAVSVLMTGCGGNHWCLLPVANSITMITECYGREMIFFAPRRYDDM